MRPRRHAPKRKPLFTSKSWRRFVRDIGIVAAVAALGYVASAIWISPASLFSQSAHATPRLLDLPGADARKELSALGFRARVIGTRTHPTAPAGVVIWQDPPPDVVLSPNSTVALTLSAGPSAVPVPDIAGLDTATARSILTAAGLTVGRVVSATGGAEPGIVIATQPAIGTSRYRGAAVGLVISRGLESNP